MFKKPTYEELQRRVQELESIKIGKKRVLKTLRENQEKLNGEKTKGKWAEDTLRKSEQLLRRAQSISNMGSWYYDLDSETEIWSDECFKLYGMRKKDYPDNVVPESVSENVYENPKEIQDLSTALAEKHDTYELEFTTVPINGQVKTIRSYCEVERDLNGNILKVFGSDHDITEQMLAEEGIKQNEKITHTLFSISNSVNTTDNLDDLYRSIYDSLNHLIKLPNFFIAIVDSEKKLLSFPFFVDEHDTKKTLITGLEKYKESSSNTSRVISTKSPLFLKKDILQRRLKQKKTIGTVSVIWIGVPLIVRNEVIGVMVIQHYSDPEYFTQKDLDLLIAVSDQVALAIDRKKAQEEIKQKERITQTLFSISNAVNITQNLNDLYKRIHSLLGGIFDVTNFYIAILDNNGCTLHFPYYQDTVDDDYASIKNFNPECSLTGLVVSKRKSIFLTKDELIVLSDKKSIWGTIPMVWMGVPLMINDEVIGVIAVQSYTDPYLYSKEDLAILTSISDQVAIAINRKRTENQLRKSEKKYRYLFNHSPAGMYEIDFTQQKFIEVNEVLCRYTGYSEDEFLSINPLDLLTKKSKKQFIEDYDTVLNGGKISNNVEYDIHTKDGQKLCVLLNSDFIYNGGKLKSARVVVHDITERKKIENMIIQSEKMMSVGGLAAGMAHEINNPLAGIMQNAQVIKNRLTSSIPANDKAALESETTMNSVTKYMEKRKILSSLDNILDAGSNAAKIVDNMLSFARKGDSSKAKCNIAQLLEKTLELAQSDYNLKKKYDFKQIGIIKEFDPDIPDVLCEESKIMQVFFNIIKNASESMYEVKGKTNNPNFTFRLQKLKRMVQIEIEDNGPGMNKDVRKRVFEPFFTTKDIKKGTGLGLSLSYFIIVEDHQGEMEVESVIGKGSKFIIRLPFS